MATLSEEDRNELQALILGFLQQSLSEFPVGINLVDFERTFPDKCDEPADWYKRYHVKSSVEALRLVPQVAKLTVGFGNQLKIELNTASKLHDKHLTEMVKGQRTKPKKNRPTRSRPIFSGTYSRRPNYALNLQSQRDRSRVSRPAYSSSHRPAPAQAPAPKPTPTPAINQYSTSSVLNSRRPANNNVFSSKSQLPTNASGIIEDWAPSGLGDQQKSATTTPQRQQPQVAEQRHHSASNHPTINGVSANIAKNNQSTWQPPIVTTQHKQQQKQQIDPAQPTVPVTKSDTSKLTSAHASVQSRIKPSQFVSENSVHRDKANIEKQPAPKESAQHKEWLRQKIVDLFTRISSEIKLLFLPTIYQNEYEEPLDPTEYGYSRITALFEDPILSKDIEINYKQPYTTVSSRLRLRPDGKENRVNGVSSEHNSSKSVLNPNNHEPLANLSQEFSTDPQFEAIDPFNLRSMQQSLQKSFVPNKEKKKTVIPIDEEVKYRTFRMIMTSDRPLEIDKWHNNFESQTKLSIRVGYYGFNNSEDFFRELVKDMPIRITKNLEGRSVALITSKNDVAAWLNEKMRNNEYKSIYVLCDKYELIASPQDRFTFRRISQEMLESCDFWPVYMCSAKNPSDIWLKVNNERLIEDQLFIESSMRAYQDYTNTSAQASSTMLPGLPRFFVKVGLPCTVYDPHQAKWCRAIISSTVGSTNTNEDIDNLEINLLLVDYGLERRKVSVKQLHCLLKDHMRIPVIPIQCRLDCVKPVSAETEAHDWNQRARVILQEYVNPPSLLACKFINERERKEKISGDAHLPATIWGVELCDTRGDEDRYLHQSLIEAGLAQSIY